MSPKTDENSTGTLYTNYNADNLCSYTVFCKKKKKIFIKKNKNVKPKWWEIFYLIKIYRQQFWCGFSFSHQFTCILRFHLIEANKNLKSFFSMIKTLPSKNKITASQKIEKVFNFTIFYAQDFILWFQYTAWRIR